MKKSARCAIAALVLLGCLCGVGSTPAYASQEQVRALGACIKMSTSGKDRIVTARWMLSALASAPQMKDVTTVDPAKKEQADREMAALFTRLMTKDCIKEAKPLFRANNPQEIEQAGGSLGQIAMTELLADPEAAQAIGAYAQFIDEEDFAQLRPQGE